VPLGILAASNDRSPAPSGLCSTRCRRTPTFVYLVPIVMLFGIGNVPAVMATIIVALPPMCA